MLIFKRKTDKASGLDLYSSYSREGTLIETDLDHWTVTRIMKYLDISGIKYGEDE